MTIQSITTTELRTKTTQLVSALQAGQSVQLSHRAQVIATISPSVGKPAQPFDAEHFLKLAKQLNLPKTTDQERERRYRKHLMEKYGEYLS